MATIAQVIQRGRLSIPLSANYNAKQELFSPALAAPNSPILIAMVTQALEWMNDRTEIYTQSDLLQVADYLIWLTGKFGLQASQITGGGGSVTPITPGGGGLAPNRIDFVVGNDSFMVDGDSGITISSFIGFNLEFDRNGVPQSMVQTELTHFTWSRSTGEFTCTPELSLGEVIALIPV